MFVNYPTKHGIQFKLGLFHEISFICINPCISSITINQSSTKFIQDSKAFSRNSITMIYLRVFILYIKSRWK